MRIKDDYMLREVAGQFIVVPVGDAVQSFNGMITLNETGAFLWRAMAQECDRDGLTEALLAEYAVERTMAEAGVDSFLEKMREAKLINE